MMGWYDDYGTSMEPSTSTWQAEGVLYLDGQVCPGVTEMTYESTSQYMSGTVARFTNWEGECANGHLLKVRAVDKGASFRSGSILKQEAPCDGSCPNPVSYDDEGPVDYIHKMTRYVCRACLTGGAVVEVSMRRQPMAYTRTFPVSRVMRFTAQLPLGFLTGESPDTRTPFVFQLSNSVHPGGFSSWIEGEVRLMQCDSRFSGERYGVWDCYDKLSVHSRESGAPTVPLKVNT